MAEILSYGSGPYLEYYTLKRKGRVFSETEDFFVRMEKLARNDEKVKRELDILVTFMDRMSQDPDIEEEDMSDLLRFEGAAFAVGRTKESCDLRLYCHVHRNNIIILFNGGIKTAQRVADCANVALHFRNANAWVKELEYLEIEDDGFEITNVNDLILKDL